MTFHCGGPAFISKANDFLYSSELYPHITTPLFCLSLLQAKTTSSNHAVFYFTDKCFQRAVCPKPLQCHTYCPSPLTIPVLVSHWLQWDEHTQSLDSKLWETVYRNLVGDMIQIVLESDFLFANTEPLHNRQGWRRSTLHLTLSHFLCSMPISCY